MSDWTTDDIADQAGRTVLITGANSGIGFEAAKALVDKGAYVVLACRSRLKADGAVDQIMADEPAGSVEILEMDLSDLASVEAGANAFLAKHDRLDVLINNAGLMAIPKRITDAGVEMQFAVNHLGHFALTGRVLDVLASSGTDAVPARVVTISSQGHRPGKMDFDNLDASKSYNAWKAYFRSKLANLLFMRELDRRVSEHSLPIMSLAAHPGASSTNLGNEPAGDWASRLMKIGGPIMLKIAQSPAMGALPTLRAAVGADAVGGEYFGPDGFNEMRGHPEKVEMSKTAADPAVAEVLWQTSQDLCGVTYL